MAGKADSVSSVSASACFIGRPNFVSVWYIFWPIWLHCQSFYITLDICVIIWNLLKTFGQSVEIFRGVLHLQECETLQMIFVFLQPNLLGEVLGFCHTAKICPGLMPIMPAQSAASLRSRVRVFMMKLWRRRQLLELRPWMKKHSNLRKALLKFIFKGAEGYVDASILWAKSGLCSSENSFVYFYFNSSQIPLVLPYCCGSEGRYLIY